MVTVVLYAQPSRDEEDDLRPENTVIESLEGFESFEIMGKKLSMFQIIGAVFGVTLLVLLIWSAYRKRERQRQRKENKNQILNNVNAKIEGTYLLKTNPDKTATSFRKNSIDKIAKSLNTTLSNMRQAAKDEVDTTYNTYPANDKKTLKTFIDETFKNKDAEYKGILAKNVASVLVEDTVQSLGERLEAELATLSQEAQTDLGADVRSMLNESLRQRFAKPEPPAPKPGFFSRFFGRGRQ